MEVSHAAARSMLATAPLALPRQVPRSTGRCVQDVRAAAAQRGAAPRSGEGLWRRVGQVCLVPVVVAGVSRRRLRVRASRPTRLHATTVDADAELAPWEIEEETEEERQARYKREADEMKLKWDARRLEEKQSAERRVAFAAKEKERAQIYGPRDPVMEAYEARMYEEARVIEVRRKQREVYERIKAFKLGRPLPPKGKEYVTLRPPPMQPPSPEAFDVSGVYDLQEDVEEAKYKAPESYVSPTGPPPPARHERGTPKAAWEDPPYHPPSRNAQPSNWPKPGTIASKKGLDIDTSAAPVVDVVDEAEGAEEEEEEEAEGGSSLTKAEAQKMKVSELKKKCQELGLPTSGTKAQLIERLLG